MSSLFTKAQKIRLFDKLGKYAAIVLQAEKDSGRYQYKEIAEITGLQPSRISEIVNNGVINEPQFIGLLSGGIMTVEKVLNEVDLSDQEKKFLQDYTIFEGGKPLKMAIIELKRLGGNPEKALLSEIERIKKENRAK